MKRFISTLCLLVGASVASYAGLITTTIGSNSGLAGGTVYTQGFESSTLGNSFPLSSLPFVNGSSTSGVTVTVSSSGPGSVNGANGTSTGNTGSTGSVLALSGASGSLGALNGSRVITPWNGSDLGVATNVARFITLTFSTQISEFLIDYSGNAGGHNVYVGNTVSNVFTGQQFAFGSTGSGSIGAQTGSAGTGTIANNFNTVVFEFLGTDGSPFNGDLVALDNLRITATNGNQTEPPPQTSGGGGEIPEPSTYGLMGAGLLALAYARRKK